MPRARGSRRRARARQAPRPPRGDASPAGAPPSGVLGYVPADIGKLHPDAEVDREGQRVGVADAEHAAHHQADGPGDAVAVAEQLAVVGDAHGVHVASDADDQLERSAHGDARAVRGLEEERHERPRWRLAPELRLERGELARRLLVALSLVGDVVDQPAERVDDGRVVEAVTRQEGPRPPERLRVVREHRAAAGDVHRRVHARTPAGMW